MSKVVISKARGLVSKKKKRFVDKQNDIDLDLSYITPRIIAMGFPSVGKEAMYRNPLELVQKFFQVSCRVTSRESRHFTVSLRQPSSSQLPCPRALHPPNQQSATSDLQASKFDRSTSGALFTRSGRRRHAQEPGGQNGSGLKVRRGQGRHAGVLLARP